MCFVFKSITYYCFMDPHSTRQEGTEKHSSLLPRMENAPSSACDVIAPEQRKCLSQRGAELPLKTLALG